MEQHNKHTQKNKALIYAVTLSAVLMLAFTLTSSIVRAEEVEGSANASASTSLPGRKPLLSPRPGVLKEQREEQREERRETMEERRAHVASTSEERRENIKERFAERRERIAEAAKERAKAYMARVVRRLEAAVNRFEKLSERLESRIEKLADAGIDMTKASELLAKANAEIAEADAAVAALQASIEATIGADNPREIFAEVKEKVRLAIEAIKEAHRSLVAVLIEVKAAGGVRADSNAASVDGDAEVEVETQ